MAVPVTTGAEAHDDLPTLLAAGVLAHVGQTLLHEAVGHGGVCLAQGERFLVLAPMWMRCSGTSALMVAAGPAMNALAACVCLLVLRKARPRPPAAGLLLWLAFAFNALVATSYLGVGAVTGFGDWAVLFAHVAPAVLWRVPALALSLAGFYASLRVSAATFDGTERDVRRRALVPAAGAAVVACLAEMAGGHVAVMPLLLALGCTLGIGFSLTIMGGAAARAGRQDITRSRWMIATAATLAVLFIGLTGPNTR